MTVFTVGSLIVGLVGLVGGAELLVKGAASIASRLGVAPVVIGLTVVAFGTSAPELAVSLSAALGGSADVAFGNVVGSNIANILLILGASAVVGGLAVQQRIVRVDVPLLIVVSAGVFAMSLDNQISRIDGLILVTGVFLYTGWLIREARSEREEIAVEYAASVETLEGRGVERPAWFNAGSIVLGLGVLVVGSQLLVNSATTIAEAAGLSELVIGLTVVAIGTSLPELATSIMAVVRGQRDIAVGNAIGSNLFNLMSVLGVTSVVSAGGIEVSDVSIRLDLPVMLAATVVLLPIIWNGFVITRWEGIVLVSFYAAYVAYLVLDANGSDAAFVLGAAVLIGAPLVAMTFFVTGLQGWRRHRSDQLKQQDLHRQVVPRDRPMRTKSNTALIPHAESVYRKLAADDYDSVTPDMTFFVRRALNAKKVMGVWADAIASLGDLEALGESFVRPSGSHLVVETGLSFEAGELVGRIAYNRRGTIVGLLILEPDDVAFAPF